MLPLNSSQDNENDEFKFLISSADLLRILYYENELEADQNNVELDGTDQLNFSDAEEDEGP